MGKIQRQFVILLTAATIIMGISTVAMLIPQSAYATQDEGNPSSSEDEDYSSNELPAGIDRTIRCMDKRRMLFRTNLRERKQNIVTL